MIKKIIKVLGVIIALLMLIVLSMVTKIDRTPYQEMPYYKAWKEVISTVKLPKSDSSALYIGFAKENITPPYPTPMAGYGNRKGKPFTTVHDSVYVRTFVIANRLDTVAVSSADLLIIPPSVYEKTKETLNRTSKHINHFFGATHSHNSVGGWYNTLVGRLFAGKYDPAIEKQISEATLKSVKKAKSNLFQTDISYEEDTDTLDIRNRMFKEDGTVDPQIRSLIFNRKNEKPFILTSYAAHSTVLNSKTMELSRDYAGVVVDSLENKKFEAAIFMAGAVGSMGPKPRGIDNFDEVNNQGASVSTEILSKNEFESSTQTNVLRSFQLKLPMRSPTPRLTTNFALRSWVFYKLFGKSDVFVNVTQINNNLLIGLPCDFSGELMNDLSNYARSKKLNLIITSFNGGYVGYITADKHFEQNTYETTTMNWYGPYNGAYFSEVVKDIIDKVAEL